MTTWVLVLLTATSIPAQNLYNTPLLQALKVTDPLMRVEMGAYEQAVFQDLLVRNSDLPLISLSTSPQVSRSRSFFGGDQTSLNTSATLSTTQNLPWGGSTTLAVTQSEAVVLPSSLWQYGFSFSASGSHPLFSPALAWETKRDAELWTSVQREAQWTQSQRARLSSVVGLLGTLALSEAQASLLALRDALFEEQGKADEALWKQGRLSFIDLSDRDSQRAQAQSQTTKLARDRLEIQALFYSTGLPPDWVPENLETFLAEWEPVAEISLPEEETRRLVEAQRRLEIFADRNSQLQSTPVITWTYSMSPQASSAGATNGWESVTSYWESNTAWNWNLGINLSVPLSPWDPSFQSGKRSALRLSQAKAVQDQTIQEQTRRDGIRPQVLRLLRDSLQEARRQEDTQRKRLETVGAMAGVGRETNLVVSLQKIVAERAHLEVLLCRLDLVVAMLQGQ